MSSVSRPVAGADISDFSAMPRHVSAEGCQFLVETARPTVGERLVVAVDPATRVPGQVRWVVDDRFALVFDQPLDREVRMKIERHGRARGALGLFRA